MFLDALVTGVRRTGESETRMFWIYLLESGAADVQPHQEILPKHLLGCPDFDCPGDCQVLSLASNACVAGGVSWR